MCDYQSYDVLNYNKKHEGGSGRFRIFASETWHIGYLKPQLESFSIKVETIATKASRYVGHKGAYLANEKTNTANTN